MKHSSIFKMFFLSQSLVILITASLFADEGGLTLRLIDQLRASLEMNAHTKSVYNAVTNNDISKLALNHDIVRSHNEIFNHKIKTKGITNQKSSGRCWLFAGLNTLRPAVIKKYNLEEFEFSQNYLTFWDKMEKANAFLERIINFRDRDFMDRNMEFILRAPIPDNGYWENVVDLIEKYGVVPKDIMPETNSSENTAFMNRLISRKLRADAVKLRKMHEAEKSVNQMRQEKEKMLSEVYKMLVMNLGRLPKEFEWRYEDANSVIVGSDSVTPKKFYKDFVGVDLRQYVDIFNDPSKDYGKHYEIDITKNLYDGDNLHFANVDIKTIKDIALKSLLDDQPVWFACDVGKNQNKDLGVMAVNLYDYNSIYGVDLKMTKAERSIYRESTVSHAMVLTGVDVKDGKAVKWLVENSWGKEKGSKGHWTLYDQWFDENVYSVIVKKKYVPKEVLKIFDQKPILRPVWDPIWSNLRN